MSIPLRLSDLPEPAPLHRPCAFRVVVANAGHPLRAALERFVEARFEAAYGASLPNHYPFMAGIVAPDGAILAAAGVRLAEAGPLFLEGYLDDPVERAIARAFDRPVARDGVAEIGSFASGAPSASLELFSALALWLGTICGRRYAVATVRPELASMLEKAGFGLRGLAEADPTRLGESAGAWGSYYERGPRVIAGEISLSSTLPLLRERLKAKSMARQARRLRSVAH